MSTTSYFRFIYDTYPSKKTKFEKSMINKYETNCRMTKKNMMLQSKNDFFNQFYAKRNPNLPNDTK